MLIMICLAIFIVKKNKWAASIFVGLGGMIMGAIIVPFSQIIGPVIAFSSWGLSFISMIKAFKPFVYEQEQKKPPKPRKSKPITLRQVESYVRLIGILACILLIMVAVEIPGQLFSLAIRQVYDNATCSMVIVNITNGTPQDYILANNAINYCNRSITLKNLNIDLAIIASALVAIFAKPISKIIISINKKTKLLKIET